MNPVKENIDELVRRIVEAVHPVRIILFGSAARGEMDSDSDIDVMVVMPDGTHRRHTVQDLYTKIVGIGISVDIVVATPVDLEKHRDNRSLIYHNALRDGVVLYAA
jgi:predicted nucleotidyltransferase